MAAQSHVLFPPAELASCLSMAIGRDTRGAVLTDDERMNYFPAFPLVAFTIVMHGELRASLALCDLDAVRAMDVMPEISVTPPQTNPTLSWSTGPVQAITVGFYPDAWGLLGGDIASDRVPDRLAQVADAVIATADIIQGWAVFCELLRPIWAGERSTNQALNWAGSHRVADWTRHVLTRAALSGPGQSARSIERRMKRWTGHSGQALSAFAQLEDLHGLRIKEPDAALAEIAAEAQFSDQSHMGRAVKKATGFSPGRLNQLIDTSESFWCYRLLGERL